MIRAARKRTLWLPIGSYYTPFPMKAETFLAFSLERLARVPV